MGVGEAICTKRKVVAIVNRPQDIGDEDAVAFFGGQEATLMRVRGRSVPGQPAGLRSLGPPAIFAGHMTVGVDRRKRAASRRPVRNAC